jgi:hypothetical protein
LNLLELLHHIISSLAACGVGGGVIVVMAVASRFTLLGGLIEELC